MTSALLANQCLTSFLGRESNKFAWQRIEAQNDQLELIGDELMLKTACLFFVLALCSFSTSETYAQEPDSDVIGEMHFPGTEMDRVLTGLVDNGLGFLIFYVEDTMADQSTEDADELWVVIVNGAGDAVYLNIFEQDNGAFVASSDIGMPLHDFMNGAGLTTTDSCEYNPLCFG